MSIMLILLFKYSLTMTLVETGCHILYFIFITFKVKTAFFSAIRILCSLFILYIYICYFFNVSNFIIFSVRFFYKIRTKTTVIRKNKQFLDQKFDNCFVFLGDFETARMTSPSSFFSCVWKIFKCRTSDLLANLFLRILIGPCVATPCDQSFPLVKLNRTVPMCPSPTGEFFFFINFNDGYAMRVCGGIDGIDQYWSHRWRLWESRIIWFSVERPGSNSDRLIYF